MNSDLNCVSWNVKGINSPVKRKKIITYLKKLSTNIAFIQETHLTDLEHMRLRRDWIGQVFFSSYTSNARGVAILINKNVSFKLISVEKDTQGRFLFLDCVLNTNRVTLVNIYGPNHDDPTFFNNILLK